MREGFVPGLSPWLIDGYLPVPLQSLLSVCMSNFLLLLFFFLAARNNRELCYSNYKGRVSVGRGRELWQRGKRPLLAGDEWVPQDHDDQVTTQEHLGDVAVLVDQLGLFALATLGDLSPHLFHIQQHQLAVSASRYSHILRYLELGLKYINLERIQFSPYQEAEVTIT